MNEVGKIWMNGRLVPFKNAKVHVLTHALHYSTSIFEGIRCYDTDDGPAIFRLQDHVNRFFLSAGLYCMKMQFSKQQITDAILDTARASRLRECYIRPLAYYGYGEMGLTPTQNKVDVSIACWEWNTGESNAGKSSGAKCKVSSWLKIDSRCQPMQAKAASNYANAALARVEALDHGYDEAIMLNTVGKVAECSVENIFVVRDGVIRTPPTSAGGLRGITRDSIIQIMEQDGGTVQEADLDRNDLYSADEVFMTGTAAEVKSVTQIDKTKIGDAKMGKVTRGLQRSFTDVVMGRNPKFRPWLTFL